VLDTHRLRVLCTVAECGSFTAAAERLHFTQSAVSQQVAVLEREIGAGLVVRGSRGVELTEAGRLLADGATSVLSELTRLEQEVQRHLDRPDRLRLGVFTTVGAHLVPPLVRRYRHQEPATRLDLHECSAHELPQRLAAGTLDAGLTWDYDFVPRPDTGLRREPLLTDPLQLVLAPDHDAAGEDGAVDLADLADEPWVVRRHDPPYADAFEHLCRLYGFEPNVVFRVADYQSMQGMVAAGIGIGLAPRLSMLVRRADLVVRPLRDERVRRVDALLLPTLRQDPRVGSLVDALRDVAAEVSQDGPPTCASRPHDSSWLPPATLAGGGPGSVPTVEPRTR
jgi:DNA-binding transcriptional LysR family regulator